MTRASRVRAWLRGLLLGGCVFATACDEPTPTAAPHVWPCPSGWVAHSSGGCGPAVWLCGADGGAADAAACAQQAPRRRDPARPFWRREDGAIAGAWPEDGEAEAPPAAGASVETGTGSCPASWRARTDRTCDPLLETACADGSEGIPGERCVPSRRCPSGPWPSADDLPAGAPAVYVLAAAAAGGSGTRDRPLQSIDDAVRAAGAGGVVVLGDGTYPWSGSSRSVTLVGLCPSRTVLASASADPRAAVVEARGAGVTVSLRNLTVRGPGVGILAADGAAVDAESVRVEGTTARGVRAMANGTVRLRDAVVARPTPSSQLASSLFASGQDARIVAERVALPDVLSVAVQALDHGAVTLSDFAIQGASAPSPSPLAQAGVVALEAGSVTLQRGSIRGVRGPALWAVAANVDGAQIAASDLVVDRVLVAQDDDPSYQTGVALAQGRTAITIERGLAQDFVMAPGAIIATADAHVTLRDLVLRFGHEVEGRVASCALCASLRGHLDAVGVRVEATPGQGVVATDDETQVSLERVALLELVPLSPSSPAAAIVLNGGAQLVGTGVIARGCQGSAIAVTERATARLTDVLVERTSELPPRGGVAVNVTAESSLTLTRARITDVYGIGVAASASSVTLDRVVIDGVRAAQTRVGLASVHGVMAVRGGQATVSHSIIRSVPGPHLLAGWADTTLRADGVLLENPPTDLDGSAAAVVHTGAAMELRGVLVRGHFTPGLLSFGTETSLVLEDSLVADLSDRVGLVAGERVVTQGGFGAFGVAGARVALRRVGIARAGGAAVAATVGYDDMDQVISGTRVDGEDVYIADVRAAPLGARPAGQPPSAATARGVWSDRGSTVSLRRATLSGGEYGVFTTCASASVDEGVISRQRAAIARRNDMNPMTPLTLTRVTGVLNGVNVPVIMSGPCDEEIRSYDFSATAE